mmetsp:Transcript_100970/g.290406  ORF Transcript_100970/g.290406 Transcript_100970/m.290406 type:complete len:243 (-) Transcript_100970:130-858(-)
MMLQPCSRSVRQLVCSSVGGGGRHQGAGVGASTTLIAFSGGGKPKGLTRTISPSLHCAILYVSLALKTSKATPSPLSTQSAGAQTSALLSVHAPPHQTHGCPPTLKPSMSEMSRPSLLDKQSSLSVILLQPRRFQFKHSASAADTEFRLQCAAWNVAPCVYSSKAWPLPCTTKSYGSQVFREPVRQALPPHQTHGSPWMYSPCLSFHSPVPSLLLRQVSMSLMLEQPASWNFKHFMDSSDGR